MSVTNRHNMTFAVKVALNPNTTNQPNHNGLGYSPLNTVRSAMSSLGISFNRISVGAHPLIVRFMKGVFNLRPPGSRYSYIWDVDKVLMYLRKLSPVDTVSLKDPTLKLTMSMALVNTARCQTLHLLSVKQFKKLRSEFVFHLDGSLKQSRPDAEFSLFHLIAYPPDSRLCVYTVLKEYIARTKNLLQKQDSRLLISYCKPH